MFHSAPKHVRWVATLGVAGALVVGGVAVAQNEGGGSKSGGDKSGKSKRQHRGPHGGPPGLGKAMKGLTYGELHVQTKEGKSRVIRLDQGKVASVSASSITVAENDGNEVTIAVDDDTRVLARPGSKTSLEDLKEGQKVLVSGPEGGTAKSVVVLPKKGERPPMPGGPGGDRQGPPPSGRMG